MSQSMTQIVENCHRQAQRMEKDVMGTCQDRFGASLVQGCLQPLTERLGRLAEEISAGELALRARYDLLDELEGQLP